MEDNKLMENPWVTKSSEVVYESAWIKVHKNDVLNPAGKDALYSYVEFKNLAIGILPLDENNNTWLVGQFRYPTNSYSWEIIEGGGNPEQEPVESAKRELKEEAGIIANDYKELMRMHLSNSATDELAIVFIARDLSFAEAEPEESEVLQLKKVHISEAYEMCLKGEITDAISVAAIYRVILELK
ncbi:MAG: NUDIX domain-containing protein [Bacteroidia bacterium]